MTLLTLVAFFCISLQVAALVGIYKTTTANRRRFFIWHNSLSILTLFITLLPIAQEWFPVIRHIVYTPPYHIILLMIFYINIFQTFLVLAGLILTIICEKKWNHFYFLCICNSALLSYYIAHSLLSS